MPNYEVVHGQVGPFPRAVEGSELPRVVSEEAVDATGPEVPARPTKPGERPVRPYEGNLKFWLRIGAIVPTDAPVTPESTPPGVLNNLTVANSPEGRMAVAATKDVTPQSKTGTVAATQPVK